MSPSAGGLCVCLWASYIGTLLLKLRSHMLVRCCQPACTWPFTHVVLFAVPCRLRLLASASAVGVSGPVSHQQRLAAHSSRQLHPWLAVQSCQHTLSTALLLRLGKVSSHCVASSCAACRLSVLALLSILALHWVAFIVLQPAFH
jgi:hypothetical protein